MGIRPPVITWAYNPNAIYFLPSAWPLVYHCVDDLAAFPGVDRAAFRRAERAAVTRAAVCIASSRPLVSHLKQLGAADVVYWPNPADVEAYAEAGLQAITPPRPTIGFIGALQSHKLDVELLHQCARLRPEWLFELVGPIGHGLAETESDAAAFASLPSNVRIRHAMPRTDLPALLASYSVGIIPYRLNEYTRSVFPMKLYEYLASGLPVVSTPLPSLVDEVDHVEFASTAAEFVASISRALESGRQPYAPATVSRRDYASLHSWTNRTNQAIAILRDLC